MEFRISDIEARVLGCLIEKDLATPEYYPLTLNALTHACNQKSNRDPVLTLEETEVVRALDALREQGLAHTAGDGGRVPKYCHSLAARLRLGPHELALLAELLLRGPQTVGELRGRAERMQSFAELEEVERVLQEMSEAEPPLVVRLPRQPGRKESRFAQLLGGVPDPTNLEAATPPEAARRQVQAENQRLAQLEQQLAALRSEFEQLQTDFATFRKQFE